MSVEIAGYKVSVPEPFLQKHLEQFQIALERYLPNGDLPNIAIAVANGAIVRAAAACGWIEGLEPDAVGDLPPWAVAELSGVVYGPISRAQEVPKG